MKHARPRVLMDDVTRTNSAPMRPIYLSGFSFLIAFHAAGGVCAQELSSDDEARALCDYSAPSPASDEAGSERERERRKVLHRRFVVTVGEATAPVIGYDELSGVLALNAYRPLRIAPNHSLALDGAGAIPFELSAERAHEIVARYRTNQARLRLEFVPAPFADSEQPICTPLAGSVNGSQNAAKKTADDGSSPKPEQTGGSNEAPEAAEVQDSAEEEAKTQAYGSHSVIHGALLQATIVDPIGRPLATFETALGREIDLMKSHNITGFLASAYPQVTVSSIAFLHGTPSYPKKSPRVPPALDRSLRSQIQKRLYGCYVRGLASNARLQGALVVQVDATADGHATIMVDSLNAPSVVGCVTERLGEIGVQHASQVDEHSRLKVTLIFRLQDNSL